MRWDETLELLLPVSERDEWGQEIPGGYERRTVRANAWVIRYSERMSVGSDVMRGALRFEVQTRMYRGEPMAAYKGKTYTVQSEQRGHRTVLTLAEVPHAQS